MTVIKRDGSEVNFDIKKIKIAITKTNSRIGEMSDSDIDRIIQIIENKCNRSVEKLSVEEIQDLVEDTLLKSKFNQTAKAYILYRDMRTRNRENKSKLLKDIAKKLNASNIVNQNANVDEASFGGRKGEANNELMKWFALNNCMSSKSKENHLNNEIYIHDLDSYAVGMHNCLSVPFDKLLAEGFNTRQTDIRPASSINTAFQLVAVIFQLQSLQQFGGVSATHLDWTMVPYVRKSFRKHFIDGLDFCESEDVDRSSLTSTSYEEMSIEDPKFKSFDKAYNYAMTMTKRELNQAVEGMYHNLNTLQSRSGNQLPFTSINYGTCTLPEGRMVIKALLDKSIEGVGKLHRTPIFPCGIFQCMKGVNRCPGEPNYDLYQLALKSTAKRLYPNYANVDWSGNAGYDRNDPKTYFSTMGALAGKEHLYIKVNDEQVQDITIKNLFELCKNNKDITGRPSQIIYNKERLQLEGKGRKNQDHSLKTAESKSGVYRITYLPQDVSYIGSSENIQQRWREHKTSIRLTGGLDSGTSFADPNIDNYLFEVIKYCDNYKEVEKEFILKEPNINIRGTSEKYYKKVSRKYDPILTKPSFKYNLSVEQELINLESLNIKVLDRNNTWTKIRHIFKNDKLNTPQMMHIKYLEYDKEYELACTEDHPLWTGNSFTKAADLKIGDSIYRADGLALTVLQVSWHWEAVDSYDIGTETGTFIGSDIIMHNCRTANGADINAEPGTNPQTKDGRGNICPVTIILPTLAMEADRDVEKFITLLDKKINEAKDMLIERFEYICTQSPDSAKFMYENGTMLGYKPEEGIRSALKHGTLALGQLGLAETLELLIGCNQTCEKGMELAKRIESLFKQRCAEFKQEWHYLNKKPSISQIKEKMIVIAEKNLGRKLTPDEISEIYKYKITK